ncbi:MAG: T9SS type A sorting domain-containing protein [Bacteroidia bacterium]|nr:T9SS type A sorting domain-containing protein [Bacteroidia bacterium]
MKFLKFTLSVFLMLSMTVLIGQSAKRYTLFEHFTQASCGPCAQQNPAFSAFFSANTGRAHHIAFHTSWPGVDPMYNANAQESDDRVDYYGVTGVPAIWVSGKYETNPGGVNEGDLAANDLMGSPIAVQVTETTNGSTRNVSIKVISVNSLPSANYVLRAAIVEKEKVYATAPGSNGEKEFPNVFRKMVVSSAGESYTPASIGNSTDYNYTYNLDATWDPAQIYVIAWVQNETTKEVINSGASIDWLVNYATADPNMIQTVQPVNVGGTILNSQNTYEPINVTLTSNAPGDWSASILKDGVALPSLNENMMLDPFTQLDVDVNITPGSSIALAKYELSITTPANPNFIVKKVYLVNNGIKDLVLGNTTENQSYYTDGLLFANNTKHGELTRMEYQIADDANILQGIYNIYANIGWAFPAFTDDMVTRLKNFMDNGGNVLVAGQDIGWDTFDPTGNSNTPANQAFYTQYLHANYVADGSTANNQLTPVASDAIYGTMSPSAVVDAYGGNMYPEELSVAGTGMAIFNYNGGAKVAGVRAQEATYKVVYLGIGAEMIGDPNVRNMFIKLTHDWFYADITGMEYDEALKNLLKQNYPNPADVATVIPVSLQGKTGTLRVVDLMGKTIFEQNLNGQENQVELNTTNWSAGTYFYHLITDGQNASTHKFTVVHP